MSPVRGRGVQIAGIYRAGPGVRHCARTREFDTLVNRDRWMMR